MDIFDRSLVCTDYAGNQHTLQVFRVVRMGDVAQPDVPTYRLWTAEGTRVERFGKGKYQVVASRLTLKSDDPSAP